tara:strand:- start:406 stop:630 length:225 start_codon:yes stop_codon:yes gene_type:complete
MPNIGGQKFPYTPEGMAAAQRAQAAQVPGNERRAIVDTMSRATTQPQFSRLQKMLGMTKKPTRSGTSHYGDYTV